MSHRALIEAAITNAVDISFQAAEVGSKSRAEEPDYLAYFYLEGLHRLEVSLNAILLSSKVKVTLSGIFCHQTPKVYPTVGGHNLSQSCELGDLLLVSLYTPPEGQGIERRALGNAVLLQSKMDAERPGDEDPQWQLYATSEGYRYKSPATLANQNRSLSEAHAALWYWSFERNYGPWAHQDTGAARWFTRAIHARSPWHITPRWRSPFQDNRCFELPFSGLVWSLFNGAAGETFYRKASPVTTSGSGWSAIVHDLISDTAKRTLTRNNAYIVRSRPNQLRGSDALLKINANINPSPGFLVRASLRDALSLMDESLGKIGAQLEEKTQKSGGFPPLRTKIDGGGPPLLGRLKDDDGKEGGMSFIIANFQEL